jgi:molybdate transport system substrate-binding protein
MSIRRLVLISFLAAACVAQLSTAQEITVAAAADLQFAIQDVAARFQKETGKSVKLIYGSSGNLFEQIQTVRRLTCSFRLISITEEARGCRTDGAWNLLYYQYGKGKIVIWVPKNSKLGLSSGLQSRMNPSIKKIAVANPPARSLPPSRRRGDGGVTHLRRGEGQTATGREYFTNSIVVVSGSADVGIVALSLALSPRP